MAWSWSHTQEAYDYAESELYKLPKETLLEIRREWAASTPDEYNEPQFSSKLWDEAVQTQMFEEMDNPELAEEIWLLAEDQATCDNGGYNAWMCPYGCGPHTVRFGPDD